MLYSALRIVPSSFAGLDGLFLPLSVEMNDEGGEEFLLASS